MHLCFRWLGLQLDVYEYFTIWFYTNFTIIKFGDCLKYDHIHLFEENLKSLLTDFDLWGSSHSGGVPCGIKTQMCDRTLKCFGFGKGCKKIQFSTSKRWEDCVQRWIIGDWNASCKWILFLSCQRVRNPKKMHPRRIKIACNLELNKTHELQMFCCSFQAPNIDFLLRIRLVYTNSSCFQLVSGRRSRRLVNLYRTGIVVWSLPDKRLF